MVSDALPAQARGMCVAPQQLDRQIMRQFTDTVANTQNLSIVGSGGGCDDGCDPYVEVNGITQKNRRRKRL